MQLRLRRSQKTSGLLSKVAVFVLDARAELRHEEAEYVRKYGLGKEVVYASEAAKSHAAAASSGGGLFRTLKELALTKLSLVITVDSLTRGQLIEGKDLSEIMAAEEAVMTACQNLKGFLATAATFDGREQVFDI
ncbi:hypothetical protein [Mesorhizobium sp. B1-1-8]|uniref:hypothetical protein n=1 Tax=Mesorhizobium sp. B1-1-8 TaxID=2589976 RepID=UPI00112BCD95|nr:hypothetical protein [Mesorhizobium sp. B1-1-8]UCI07374.1 hypothetical protein FJ974_26920 [Mesorhizobium sp. B1-1-8]